MEPVTSVAIETFLQRLGERYTGPAVLYLLGGGALCLLGSPRETRDVDFAPEVPPEAMDDFRHCIADLSAEMRLDLEEVPLAEFMPLPPLADQRRRIVGRYGQIQVYIFDPYSIALSKIARGFESDLEDVIFMLHSGLIEHGELEDHFRAILPQASKYDIDPKEFSSYFCEIDRRQKHP